MRTIGRRLQEGHGPDRRALCSYCGVAYLRSELTKDPSGNLACPDDAPGLDIVSLTEGNARLMRSRQPKTVGPSDGNADQFTPPPSPGFENPNGPPTTTANIGPTGPLSVVVSLWLRADNVRTDATGTLVESWTDYNNRGNNPTAPTPGARPALIAQDATLQQQPTVTADGVAGWLQGGQFRGGPGVWIWMILRQNGWASLGTAIACGFVFSQLDATPGMRITSSGTASPENDGAPIGTWKRAIVNANLGGLFSVQLGAVVASAAGGGGYISPFSQRLAIFAGSAGGQKASVSVAEVLICDGAPTVAEIAAIEAYGALRYGGGCFA